MKLSKAIEELEEIRKYTLYPLPSGYGLLDQLIMDWHRKFIEHVIEQLRLVDELR